MKSEWTKNITDKDLKQTHVSALKHSSHIKQLREILEAKEKDLMARIIANPDNMGNNWAMYQAHLNGRLFDLKETLSLLNFDQ